MQPRAYNSGVSAPSLQILRLLDSFIKTDYPDPEVLIFQIKWSCFYTRPQGCTSFPTTSNPRWDLASLKHNLNWFNWLNRKWRAEQSTNPSAQPLATVDTRWRLRYLWVARHLSHRDSPARLMEVEGVRRGGERGGFKLEADWVALPVFPLQVNILRMWDTVGMTLGDDGEAACGQRGSHDLLEGRECGTTGEWGWMWEMR